MTATGLDKTWTRFILHLKKVHPFFASVALFARFSISDRVELAHTQGKELIVAPGFLQNLSEEERFSYLLHQVLHLALNHPFRGINRNIEIWNVATDIVVNNIIRNETEWPVAPKTADDCIFDGDSAERIYARLLNWDKSEQGQQKTSNANAQSGTGDTQGNVAEQARQQPAGNGQATSGSAGDSGQPHSQQSKGADLLHHYGSHCDISVNQADMSAANREYWRSAMIKAQQLTQKNTEWGRLTNSLRREVELAAGKQLDWQALLWKYATPAFNDYVEFDRRFLYRQLYIEYLQSEELRVDVVIDTSGSIGNDYLGRFISEMLAIHGSHPDVHLRFYYVDVEINGPFDVPEHLADLPPPVGAGGTSFKTYFNRLSQQVDILDQPQAVIYFTDGFGEFPGTQPSVPVLWIMTEDGEQDDKIPFGQIVRIQSR